MRFVCLFPLLLTAVVVAGGLAASVPGHAQTSADPIDRELVVRFTRAYGMAKEAFKQHSQSDAPSADARDAMLRQPNELDAELRQELTRILALNGLQRHEWQMMFARMEADEDLRRRVRSLSTPFE
jgi:hypothetical protein